MPAFPPKTNYAAGDVLTAAQMNDVGNALSAYQFTVGKNKIINGAFDWNQRNFSSTTTTNSTFIFDRTFSVTNSGATVSFSAQTFTPGSAPVSGYEAKNFLRATTTASDATNGFTTIRQAIESVRTLAGQTVTISFWAKAASGTPKVAVELRQSFGTGGSPSALSDKFIGNVTIGTTWQRYSVTGTVDSIAGKTIGTNNDDYLMLLLWTSAGTAFNSRTGSIGTQLNTIDFWGVQVEAGSTATPFTTASGTIQGELALCKYYFRRYGGNIAYENFGVGQAVSTSGVYVFFPFETGMRATPVGTYAAASNFAAVNATFGGTATFTGISTEQISKMGVMVSFTGSSGLVAGNASMVRANNTTAATIDFSAEL